MSYSAGYDPRAGIAIVGIAGRFPGAQTASELWRNLVAGKDTIARGDDLVTLDDVPPALRDDPHFVRAAGVIEGEDQFDPVFFGMTVREAELMDPQHRIFLQTAWEALEDAGYAPQSQKAAIGVFASTGPGGYLGSVIAPQASLLPAGSRQLVMFGNEKDFLATRISYRLNLRGPSMAVQTACSSSLVAVCEAVASLEAFRCDMALAGGVAIPIPLRSGNVWHEGSVISPDGYCRAFDAGASGTSPGSGAGIVVLKRLEDAIADGDSIYAVIKGVALNNDGSERVSFAAPSVDGQMEVIASAQALAGTDPDTITYVETHGTGTSLGDPIEIEALTQAFRLGTDARGYCAIGSLKTNVGHMDTAAGVGGLIKAALAIRHGQIPASLHYERPNPAIDFESSPFYVNTSLKEWRRGKTPRRAGVSSFGMGGTNAHVVLEEPPAAEERQASEQRPRVLIISARSEAARDASVARLGAHIEANPDVALEDVAHTLRVGRERFDHWAVGVARSTADANAMLADSQRLRRGTRTTRRPALAYLFPGQGAQTVRMGQQLYEAEDVFRDVVDRCAESLSPMLGADLRALMYPPAGTEAAASERLAETRVTQPALFVIEYALAELLRRWGVRPAAMIGHSLGEYVAACVAGTFSVEDALRVVSRRAELMQQCERGEMFALRLAEEQTLRILPPGLSIAAVNAPGLTVVSGASAAVEAFANETRIRGIEGKRLNTSHAFHSSMMDSALEPFREFMRGITLRAPELHWVSSVTGNVITDQEATDPGYWVRQIRQPVRFSDGIRTLLADPDRVFLEVGPGRTLSTLVGAHADRTAGQAIDVTLPSASDAGEGLASVLGAVGRMWCTGVDVDWKAIERTTPRRVHLPTYPFETRRIWLELGDTKATPLPSGATATASNERAAEPAAAEVVLDQGSFAERLRGLFVTISGQSPDRISTTAQFIEMGFDSLFLTQLSGELKKRFGVVVSFRDLLERFSSIDALAAHVITLAPSVASAGGTPSKAATAPRQETTARPVDAHGPFRPIQKGGQHELTGPQRAALDDLIARWTRKTASSKRLVQTHRNRLADPRTAAGFRSTWKEIIYPIVTERSLGSRIWDVDGNEYVDFVSGFGAVLLGHSPPFVTNALADQIHRGFEIGPQSPLAGDVAERICAMAGMERTAFCNTGSEAVTAAFRVARTVTMRDTIVMFAGSYHGVFDEVTMRAVGSATDPRSAPVAPGIMHAAGENIVILNYGDPAALDYISDHIADIAAVIVEPVQSRRLDLQPREFLHEIRRITATGGAALIFDEIISGFRVHQRGAQAFFDIQADIGTYGKVVAGGLPLGVVAGSRRFMDALDGGSWQYGDDSSPEVGVTFFAGTFIRHPLALAAARAVLQHLSEEGPSLQRELNLRTRELARRLNACAIAANAPVRVSHFGSVFSFAPTGDATFAGLFPAIMRDKGVYIRDVGPSFVSTAHSEADFDRLVGAVSETLHEMLDAGFFQPNPVEAPASDGIVAIATANPASVRLPLTEAQREVWLATQMAQGVSAAFNICFGARFAGEMSIDALQRAINALFARHEGLRVRFDPSGESQTVSPPVPVDLRFVDLSAMSVEARLAEVDRLLDAETREPLPLDTLVARARVICESATSHVVVLTVHHIVCDGYSTQTLIRDFRRLFDAEMAGLDAILPPPGSYVSFVQRQTGTEQLQRAAIDEAFWLERLHGTLPVLELPNDLPRPAVRTSNAGRIDATVSPELYKALRAAGARHGSTLFSTLLASFQAFLSRITGQDDLIVGIPVALQAEAGEHALITHATNMVPLRIAVDGDVAFGDHLRASATELLRAKEHQTITFGSLLRSLNIPRNPSRPPLVAVTFNVDRVGRAPADSRVQMIPLTRKAINFEIDVNVVENGDDAVVHWTYNADLFSEALITGLAESFVAMLEGIAADPASPVAALPLVSGRQSALFDKWNDTARPYDLDCGLHALIEKQVIATPDATAVVFGATTLTYAELDARANQVANVLRARGAGRDMLIGVCMERSIELVVALLGVLKAGAAYVPFDPALPADRLAFLAEDAGVPIVLIQERLRAVLPVITAGIIAIDAPGEVSGASRQRADVVVRGADLAYMIYTSGSTGRPKGALNTHRGIVNRLRWMQDEYRLTASDVVLQKTPFSFDVSVWEFFWPLLAGATLVVARPEGHRDAEYLVQLIRERGVTTLHFVPSMLPAFLDAPGARDCVSIRQVMMSGEALTPDLQKRFFARFPSCALHNLYGPTEAAVDVSFWRCVRDESARAVPIGRPIANTRLHVLDQRRQRVPAGVVDELYIGGVGVGRGYHNRAELTAERFLTDPFDTTGQSRLYRTGDLARHRTDGALEYIGRTDFQVKLRGFRIELGEIEAALTAIPEVREAAVVMSPDASGDQRLVAYVATEHDAVSVSRLRESLAQTLPSYMIPAAIVRLDRLPLTPSGKLDRRALPSPESGGVTSERPYVAPQADHEQRLVRHLEQVLGVERVGMNDDFFELGGHSITATRVAGWIREEFRVEFPVYAIFEAPTVSDIGARLDAAVRLAANRAGEPPREEIEL